MENITTSSNSIGFVKLTPEFKPFSKIPRLNREIVITEKIDGSNASVYIDEKGDIYAGSRTRWITPGKKTDNYGFASWVEDNKVELLKLGPGRHFGEWWGQGINRGYGLTERRFSLFNVERYSDNRPACCGVVPVLYRGLFDGDVIKSALTSLRTNGSVVVPGWMKPEGIVVFHTAGGHLYKVTCENDEKAKGDTNVQ